MNAAVMTPAWCADAYVMHQIFRKLGFTPDEIFFDCCDTLDRGPGCVVVVVERDDKRFIFNLGPVDEEREAAYEIWTNFALYMNAAPAAEHQAMWDTSELQQKLPRMELILRLVDKGFVVGGLSAREAEMLKKHRETTPRGEGS